MIRNSSTAIAVVTFDDYGIRYGWLAVLFVASALLLLSAITRIIMDVKTIVPDVLGFARRRKCVGLPQLNNTASSAEGKSVGHCKGDDTGCKAGGTCEEDCVRSSAQKCEEAGEGKAASLILISSFNHFNPILLS